MNLKVIDPGDIIVGAPLLWDIYGFDRSLSLRKGTIVENQEQLDEMVERGLMIEAVFADNIIRKPGPPGQMPLHARQEPVVRPKESPSVMRTLHAATKRLERLLYGLQTEVEAQAHFLEVANVIISAVDLNPDIALGSIMLNQDASHYAVRHGIDTAILAIAVARAMQKTPEEITILTAAALTMNVGMLRQQDVWQNKIAVLTEAEQAIIRQHPAAGAELLRQAGIDHPEWLQHVVQHHENDDGSGYPQGTLNTPLSQITKILAFADRYCACVARRQYRHICTPQMALREVLFAGGKPHDPLLAAYFVRELTNFPPGTPVRLQNGETAIVIHRPRPGGAAMAQTVTNARGEAVAMPLARDCSKPNFAITEAIHAETLVLRFGMQQLWGDEAAL